jgi:hypothetical protein
MKPPRCKSKVVVLLLVVASLLLCAQCQTAKPVAAVQSNDPPIKPAPATPIDAKKAELGGKTWEPAWDGFIEKSIPTEMLGPRVPHDVKRFCPNFYQMSEVDKRAFWAYFFQALAGAEAGLDPKTRVHQTAPEVNTRDEVSGLSGRTEGLLQLAYADSKRYGCDFDWQADRKLPAKDPQRTILQPERNLACGIRILENQIIEKHEPLLTRSSYWSTLQPGRLSYRVFARQMVNPPEACGLKVKATPVTPATTTATVKAQAQQAKSEQ